MICGAFDGEQRRIWKKRWEREREGRPWEEIGVGGGCFHRPRVHRLEEIDRLLGGRVSRRLTPAPYLIADEGVSEAASQTSDLPERKLLFL